MGGLFGLGPPLFVVVGWFSASSLARRGPARFLGSRLLRLGVPLLVAVVRHRWPTHGPVMRRAGRGSYAAYVLHPVVLVLVMLAFRSVPLGPELKFLAVSVVAAPGCFAVGYAASQLPGIGRVV